MLTTLSMLAGALFTLQAQLTIIETAEATSTPPIVLTVEDKIRAKAVENGFDPDLLVRIAKAESNLVPTAKNPTSSASGLFQIIKGTWQAFECEGEVFNEDDNIECAMKIMHSGPHHWNASKNNW